MSKDKGKLCSCGFPQSEPIPHEHDQTVREKAIVKHFENRMRDLEKQHKDLLAACKMCFAACYMSTADFLDEKQLAQLKAAIEKAKP